LNDGGSSDAARPQASTPAAPSKTQVHVGCSGWFYWHWRGGFYPAGLPTKDWFRHFSKHFGTVELNAPFYSWPTVAAVRVWLRQIGRRKFVYTVKASELINHVKRFAGTKTLIRDFGHIADLLGPRMGCFLFQLPPSPRSRLDLIDFILLPTISTRQHRWGFDILAISHSLLDGIINLFLDFFD
jgi:uncharacterized protein YecE (DUF72 family)